MIPEIVVKTTEDLENEAAGWAQVWECPKCKWRYESWLSLTELSHPCGKESRYCRLVWPRSGARQKSESP